RDRPDQEAYRPAAWPGRSAISGSGTCCSRCRSLPMQYRSSKRASFETRRRIDRLVEALTAGSEPMPSVGPALVGLDRERERLERDLAAAQARDVTPTGSEVI